MKKNAIVGGIIIFVIAATIPEIAQAQGTLYLSSLSPTSTGSAAVGSDSWLAAAFTTGANTDGYALNSIQLAMTDASGSPGGFTVKIYSADIGIGINPGSDLGTLTGPSDPRTAGIYAYTASSSLALLSQTTYFIVVTSSAMVATGAYNWNESAFPPSVNTWHLGINGIDGSGNGTSGWTPIPYLGVAQFAIYATPAPEPGIIGLFALGGLFVAFHRRKVSKNHSLRA